MASLLDMIGQSPQGMAISSTPDNLKGMFGSLLETMVRDAQQRSDPISQIGDVGRALFHSAGSGTPFGPNLAALDTQRQNAVGGAANMFMNIMSLDKQLAELQSQDRRHQETLAETKRAHDLTNARTIDIANENRASREENARMRSEDRAAAAASALTAKTDALHEKVVEYYGKDLDAKARARLRESLAQDENYQKAKAAGDQTAMENAAIPHWKNLQAEASDRAGIPVPDSNSVRAAVAGAYGGAYDAATSQFKFTDPSSARRAVEVSADAERRFIEAKKAGTPLTHSEAAQQAFVARTKKEAPDVPLKSDGTPDEKKLQGGTVYRDAATGKYFMWNTNRYSSVTKKRGVPEPYE